jgi:hypothetical protein
VFTSCYVYLSRNSFLFQRRAAWCCSNAEPPYNTWRTPPSHMKMCFFLFISLSLLSLSNNTVSLARGRCFHISIGASY